ncbi:MAG: alpha-ketoglutarate-dependent dioxygenase AlkB [Nitriliruptor sp.]|uniref:alpha-ketoglutarate-dependent dioxygenase AlkB n=1 Tax=Nitriliruptor sp. TaxID=2448056 RepID=UPI0034A00510
MDTLTWQTSLFDGAVGSYPGCGILADPGFAALRRRQLDESAWVDHAPGWLASSDALLETCVTALPWAQRQERIQGGLVPQPRLTARLRLGALPAELGVLDELGELLSRRYGVRFETVGANLYRDGRDSVAWHGDRVLRERLTATVATVSLGHPRTFRLKPAAGGASIGMLLGRGDLLVMGGTCQRTWKHAVPKVSSAGARVSLAFRHGDPPQRL